MSEPAYAETPVEAYLALEAASTPGHARHEFWDGRIRAMGGASMRHHQLVLGIGSELRAKLSNGPCRVLVSDMRVRLSAHRYVYPDVVVACPPEVDAQQRPETLTNPRVVFEVLSPSTAAVDRGDKLDAYRAIESLTDYVIVDPDRETFDHYARNADGSWLLRTLSRQDSLQFEGLDVALMLDRVFD